MNKLGLIQNNEHSDYFREENEYLMKKMDKL